jgi:hypothetical protein
MSKRDAPMDIISMAQQARPKVMGHTEFLRTQLTAKSMRGTQAQIAALQQAVSEGAQIRRRQRVDADLGGAGAADDRPGAGAVLWRPGAQERTFSAP